MPETPHGVTRKNVMRHKLSPGFPTQAGWAGDSTEIHGTSTSRWVDRARRADLRRAKKPEAEPNGRIDASSRVFGGHGTRGSQHPRDPCLVLLLTDPSGIHSSIQGIHPRDPSRIHLSQECKLVTLPEIALRLGIGQMVIQGGHAIRLTMSTPRSVVVNY